MLTTKELATLKPSDKGRMLTDGGSLYGQVYVASDNAISVHFRFSYKSKGKKRWLLVGTWPKVSLANIRRQRDAIRVQVQSGIDPIEERKKEAERREAEKEVERIKAEADHQEAILAQQQRLEVLAEKQARMTVRKLFVLYRDLELSSRKDKGESAEMRLKKYVFDFIGDMAIDDVRKGHIQEIMDNIKRQATAKMPLVRTAKVVLSELRQMFHFAMERDYLEADPTALIKKAKLGKEKERQRFLDDAEIIELMQKLPHAGMFKSNELALLLQLATGARIGEIVGAQWQHINFEACTWHLPETKNGYDHTIHLSDYSLQLLQELHDITGLTPMLFPSSRDHSISLCNKTISKQVADRQKEAGAKPMQGRSKDTQALVLSKGKWTPHDLRRSFETGLLQLGVLPEVAHKCTNHIEQNKMKSTYQVAATYAKAMRQAWDLWGRHLELLNAKAKGRHSNVLPFKQKAS